MNVKLIALDLDNTLAKPNNKATRRDLKAIFDAEAEGTQIVILSGKPSLYLLGFCRQLGLDNVIVSGENGGDIYFGNSLPPTNYIKHEITEKERDGLALIQKGLDELGFDYFYQPNKYSITPFYIKGNQDSKQTLIDYAKFIRHKVEEVDVYINDDCVDFTPSGINKGKTLKKIIHILNKSRSSKNKINKDEVYVIGDSSNDIPMFELGYNNIFIRTNFDHIKGKRYRTVQTAVKDMRKGEKDE